MPWKRILGRPPPAVPAGVVTTSPSIGLKVIDLSQVAQGTAGGDKKRRKYMSELTRLGWARGRMLPVAIVAAG